MLSIRFNPSSEWWVSGPTFDRLFQAALDSDALPETLEHWRHIADANGGFSLQEEDAGVVRPLTTALRDTAAREVPKLANAESTSADGGYRVELLNLLRVLFDANRNDEPTQGCLAGLPCPREGFWWTPARPGSRNRFVLGEPFPEVHGAYGDTVWQWDEQQDQAER